MTRIQVDRQRLHYRDLPGADFPLLYRGRESGPRHSSHMVLSLE